MTSDTIFTMNNDDLNEVIRITGLGAEPALDREWVIDTLLRYDWQDADEHQKWIDEASLTEIASWLAGIRYDELMAQ